MEAFDERSTSVFHEHDHFIIDPLDLIHEKGDHKNFCPFVLSRFCGTVDGIYFLDLF